MPLIDTPQRESLSLTDYRAVFRRRFSHFWIPASLIFLLAVVVALSLPSTYRSIGTILIEQQEVPEGLIRTTLSGYASQQVRVISQRVLTNINIGQIIDEYGLYGIEGAVQRPDLAQLADGFRSNVTLKLVSAEIIDPASRSSEAAIAFNLGFDSQDPRKAQTVATALVDLFKDENVRSWRDALSETSELLAADAEAVSAELKEKESALAAFKEANLGALPERFQYNLSVLEQTKRELLEAESRIAELAKRRIEIESNLVQISPYANPQLDDDGELILSDQQRLRAALAEYRDKATRYSDDHPDIVYLRREIESLRPALEGVNDSILLREQLAYEKNELAALRARYTEDHPDVAAAKAVVAKIQAMLDSVAASDSSTTAGADNPVYLMMKSQLDSTESDIRALRSRSRELQARANEVEALIRQAPQVEKDYLALEREYATAEDTYRDIMRRRREAYLDIDVEREQQGLKFTVIEPPVMPIEPIGPNRLSIVILGLISALTIGLCSVAFFEMLDRSIRGSKALTAISGAPPLVTVPYLDNSDDLRAYRRHRLVVASWIIAAIFAASAIVFMANAPGLS